MALPTSTIVLAVATCIPFGLAIRDTVTDKYEPRAVEIFDEPEEEDEDAIRERELREQAEEYARVQLEREEERRDRAAKIRTLYHPEVAAPGSLFTEAELGDAARRFPVEPESPPGMWLRYEHDGMWFHTLSAQLFSRPDGDCESLQGQLRVAWGEPKSLDDRWIWMNHKLRQRAVWNSEDCMLSYERFSTVDVWLEQLPVNMLGKRVEELHEHLGVRTTSALVDDHSTWTMLGIGTGYQMTAMSTDNVDGKVVAIVARFHADPLTQTLLGEAITKLVGKAPEIPADRSDHEIWKPTRKTPRFELIEGAPQSMLIIGVRPE